MFLWNGFADFLYFIINTASSDSVISWQGFVFVVNVALTKCVNKFVQYDSNTFSGFIFML